MCASMRAIFLGFVVALSAAACGLGVTVNTPCTTSNCTGCCDQQSGKCEAGNQAAACGTGGKLCIACATAEVCSPTSVCKAAPQSCSASNCDGCCDATGVCFKGQSSEACGASGASCAACMAGQTCQPLTAGSTFGGSCR